MELRPMLHIIHKTNFLTILFTLFFFKQALSQYHYKSYFCYETLGNYTEGSKYETNLNRLLANLTSQASLGFFNNHTVGQGIDTAYGLYLCRGDLDNQQCHDCIEGAASIITENCPVEKEAIVWYDECMVRYANRLIFDHKDESIAIYSCNPTKVSDPEKFGTIFEKTVNNTIMEAAYNKSRKGYAAGQADITLFETLYLMGQCTTDIVGSRCERCLRVAVSNIGAGCGAEGVSSVMFLPSCSFSYDRAPFVMDVGAPPIAPAPTTLTPSPPLRSGTSTRTTISPIWMCIALCLLMIVGYTK